MQVTELNQSNCPAQALSVMQPWADLLLLGHKPVENRTWAPKHAPGLVAIHASMKYDSSEEDLIVGILVFVVGLHVSQAESILAQAKTRTGLLVGEVNFDALAKPGETGPSDTDWRDIAQYGWFAENPKAYSNPMPAKGMLGIWNTDKIWI